MFKQRKTYCCFLCGDTTHNKDKANLCINCLRLKKFIIEYGMRIILDFIASNSKASAPPYST